MTALRLFQDFASAKVSYQGTTQSEGIHGGAAAFKMPPCVLPQLWNSDVEQ